MITKKEVEHIAKLARLGLTKKEIEKFQKELSSILDFVEKLKKVDISKIEPMSHSVLVENVMREDYYPPATLPTQPKDGAFAFGEKPRVPTHPKIEKTKKLLELAPETKDGYLKVKSILK